MRNRQIGSHIVMSILIIALVFVSLLFFMRANNKRIVSQNESYIADATILSADHINDRIRSALNNIQTIAALTGNALNSPVVDTASLTSLSLQNPFDYLLYMAADDDSDGEAYINGMQGKTGVCTVYESDKHLFSFYTPMYFKGEIIGVLCGLYGEESMQNVITSDFFGVTAKTYLCSRDGKVITAAGDAEPPENMLETILNSSRLSEESEHNVLRAFESDESYSFSFNSSESLETAYIASLDYNYWVLIQCFPSTVSAQMQARANKTGIVLVGCIILSFLIYIVFLLVIKRKNELTLINEKKEISRIVESVTALFVRFAVADLKHDSYYYVAKTEGMPPKGKYTDLVKYVSQFYVDEEDMVRMADVVIPEHIQEHMTEDVEYLQYEYHIIRGDSDRWENVSLICLKRENGKPVSILYAVQNITERKRKELESRFALQNAFDAAKAANQAKSDFLSRMSHDIRTPMNAVMGMTTVAAMHLDDRERLVDCLNKITTSSRHLLALINDILDMSKIESGKVTLSEEPFNLAEMIESLLTIMHPQIKARRQKINMTTANIIHEDVIGDTLRLRQVFVNIMGNAVKFTPEEGSISLDIRETESLIPGKACFEFVFTDTGIGMEESFVQEIFEPFSRSSNPDSRKIEGTGLGMPIAKNIVSMMNGDIKVESKLGVGSKFTVRLHLTVQNNGDADAHCLEGLKILIADDDREAVESTCEMLNSIGIQATGVSSGAEAVDAVLKQHEQQHTQNDQYAAVILDWQMPDPDGVQTAAEIRRKVGTDVPVIILSAYDWTEIEQEAKECGVNAFIAKPLFRSRLIYVLKSLIAPDAIEAGTRISDFTENQYGGKRILLAEDNELNREIANELLSMIGVQVEMVFDGQQAFERITQMPVGYYDLVFMDIQMPNMNGYEATKAIRAAGRDDLKTIPIVAMSADAFSDDIYRAKEAGMNDHISKPVELAKLSEALEKWLK